MNRCPCGGDSYETCCAPRHTGVTPAPTAEALMRSRYSAFVKGDVTYLARTQTKPADGTWDETKKWTLAVTWLSLEIVDRVEGLESSASGLVEFIARYLEGEKIVALHERSSFVRGPANVWLYDSGKPQVTTTKVERNQSCPCGSGKKFKQCHA